MESPAQQPLGVPAPWFLISPPQAAQGTIPRERLVRALGATVPNSNITLVAAPSGYGKTVLLAEWARLNPRTTAWLTLTHHDEGRERLVLAGILSAIHRLTTQSHFAASRVSIAPNSNARALIGRIAELIESTDEPVNVVVDDAHFAGAGFAENVIAVLTNLTAGKLHFILCGKPEITAWFVRQIAAQEARVFAPQELAFTVEEVSADLATDSVAGMVDNAAEVIRVTGGWPIAVHLHRLTKDMPPAAGGSARLLADYIAGTVLNRLSPQLAEFILSTVVCNRLTPALARELSDTEDAESLLEECVAQGLFLSCHIDFDGSKVYRWHDEFAARCRDILSRKDVARYRELDIRAAKWLEPSFPGEAVQHAMRAEMPELAFEVIRSSWVRVVVEAGATTLNSQCLGLPQPLSKHPEVLLIRACCLNQLGDTVGAQLLTKQASASTLETPRFLTTRALAALFVEDDQYALAAAADTVKVALEEGHISPITQVYCLFLLGWTELRLRRDPHGAVQLLEVALREADAAQKFTLARRARSNLLFALSYSGHFARVRALISDERYRVDHDEDWHHYDGGIELFARGFTEFWQNEIADAAASFRALASKGGHGSSYAALARVYLAFCAASEGRPAGLRVAHGETSAISAAQTHGVPWPAYQAIARAELFAAAGDFDRALATVEPTRTHENIPVVRAMTADLLRRAGRLGEAAQMLAALSSVELAPSYLTAMTHVTASLIAHERGDTARAHRLLERALDAAVPEGVIRPFESSDERLQLLLVQHAAAGTAHEEFVAARISAQGDRPVRSLELGALLSAREREIYGYLCTTMTATEIGEALFVSVNTIRTHQRAIYRKLGVTNRRDAIRLRL